MVADPEQDRVFHIGLTTLRCPGLPIAETMQPMDLAEFLLTRITEDEALAAADRLDGLIGQTWHHWVLDECAAKRRIVEHCEPDMLTLSSGDDYVLRVLALPYADHVDYLEEWRP
jgi:hypothetical protein